MYAIDAAADVDARVLLSKTTADPVAAQRAAQELYQGLVDWDRADWSNPLLKQLSALSALSNHDLPQTAHLRCRLRSSIPLEHEIVRNCAAGVSAAAKAAPYLPDLEIQHAEGCAAAGASKMAAVYGLSPSTGGGPLPAIADPAARLRPLPTLASATQPPPSDVASASLTPLLHLSAETIANDPQLGALIRQLAERHAAHDPQARRLLAGTVTELPDVAFAAKATAADRLRLEATLPSVKSPNRAFHDSDIVAYDDLRRHAGPDPPSMHAVGHETWFEKAVDVGAHDEDQDLLRDYHDELTTVSGRCLAADMRATALAESEKERRVRRLAQPQADAGVGDARLAVTELQSVAAA